MVLTVPLPVKVTEALVIDRLVKPGVLIDAQTMKFSFNVRTGRAVQFEHVASVQNCCFMSTLSTHEPAVLQAEFAAGT
jgi:hypothetical protein